MSLEEHRRKIINDVINIEGAFSDDPQDSGGATMLGITHRTASKYGYNVNTLTKPQAFTIYERGYWHPILLDEVFNLSARIAGELFDTGVNTGTSRAVKFLQRALNALNNGGSLYPDVLQDGKMGSATLGALRSYLAKRGINGESTLLNMLNSQQSSFYLELAEKRPKDEKFQYGWQKNRVDDVETHSAQALFGHDESAPSEAPELYTTDRSYTTEDVKTGAAPGTTFFKPTRSEYKPLREATQPFNPEPDLPADYYEWQQAQEHEAYKLKNSKSPYKSKIIGVAVGTFLTYATAKFGVTIPPEVTPYVETSIVAGGLGAIAIARRWFTNSFLA